MENLQKCLVDLTDEFVYPEGDIPDEAIATCLKVFRTLEANARESSDKATAIRFRNSRLFLIQVIESYNRQVAFINTTEQEKNYANDQVKPNVEAVPEAQEKQRDA